MGGFGLIFKQAKDDVNQNENRKIIGTIKKNGFKIISNFEKQIENKPSQEDGGLWRPSRSSADCTKRPSFPTSQTRGAAEK